MAGDTLTPEQCQACDEIQQAAQRWLQYAHKCKACNFPVDEIIQNLQEKLNVATAIKSNFAPHSP